MRACKSVLELMIRDLISFQQPLQYQLHCEHHPDLDQSDPVDAFTNEIAYAISALEGSVDDGFLSGIGARDALALCYKEAESIATGKIVVV